MDIMDFIPQFGNNTDVSGYGDDNLAQMELKRKLKLAQALQEQETPQGQIVGGRYVAPSWTQNLANMAGKLVGAYREKKAVDEYGQFQKTQQQKQAEALERFGKVFEPKKVVTQGAYEIQKPVEQTQTPTSPYGTTEQLGATSPWTNNLNQTTKTIQVPMATTEERQPTMDDIRAGFAQYARDTRNPKLLEDMYMKQYANLMSPKKYSIHNIGDVGIVLDENGRPTGQTYDFTQNKPESKSNLEKEYNFMREHGYKGSAQNYFDMKQQMSEKERKDLDIKLKQLGIDQYKLYYETGYGTPPASQSSKLKPGAVVNGWKYNGGDPNQQSSWSKQ